MEHMDHSLELQLLEDLALLGHEVLDMEKRLDLKRKTQKRLTLMLVLHSTIRQAEIARVANLHRLTVARWTREANAAPAGRWTPGQAAAMALLNLESRVAERNSGNTGGATKLKEDPQ